MDASDEKILTLFSKGESKSQAINLLLSAYEKKVYWVIRRMVIDHDDANDLTQETFIKVWNYLDGFKQNSKLYTWIYRIATNEALNFLRKKRRIFFLPLHDVEKELEKKLNSNITIEANDIDRMLQEAMLKLPDKQRLVFQLRYFDEMPYEQIAAITDTSEGALKASYHFAHKKIEALLKSGLNH